MAYLTKDDLTTHIYAEVRDEITRADDTLITKAITTGVGMAKSYLNRYDLVAMFGVGDTNPTFTDEFLNSVVKDIVCWHLIKLCNPNIDLTLFRQSYEDAIRFLEKVQRGGPDPAWPLRADDPNTPNDDAGNVEYRSLLKRTNHY